MGRTKLGGCHAAVAKLPVCAYGVCMPYGSTAHTVRLYRSIDAIAEARAGGGPSHAPPIMMILKNLFPTVTLLSVAAAQQMCSNSPPQLCRMMCPPTNCPSGHCAMRKGRCCSMSCVKRPGSTFASPACMDNESAADKLCKGSCSDLKNSCGKTLGCGPNRVNVAKLCPKTCGRCSKNAPSFSSSCMDNESAADKLCKGSCSDLKNSCGKTLDCGPRRVNVAKLCPKTCGRCSKKFPPGYVDPGFGVDSGFGRRVSRGGMCPNSPLQMCRMMCRPKYCPAGQCAMREGNCCNMKCVASGDH
eukprot:COSAG05_NODE_192_length_14608_cov_6.266386_4_plen_301_part_00